MMSSVFEKISKEDFFELADSCSEFFKIDKESAYESISEVKRERIPDESKNHIKCLEKRWYFLVSRIFPCITILTIFVTFGAAGRCIPGKV